MIAVEEIRGKLAAVQAGQLPLWDFYAWLEIASLNMHRDSAQEAMKLVGAIKLIFADYDSGEIDEESLGEQLSSLLHPVTVLQSRNDAVVTIAPFRWSSDSQGVQLHLELPRIELA